MIVSIWSPLLQIAYRLYPCLPGCSHLSYPDRLARLNLDSLVVRRLRHDLILTYKIVFGLTAMNPEDFFTFANSNHNTSGHAYKLLPSHCRVNVRKGFFAERVVKPWNCLPAELHNFSSLPIFKSFVFSTDLSDFVTC